MRVLITVGFLLLALFTRAAQPVVAPARDAVRLDEKTEAVIKGALKWLASKQQPNGAWASSDMEQQHPIAITGYALMAMQAAGQLPGEGEFGKNVSLGMQYLLVNTSA